MILNFLRRQACRGTICPGSQSHWVGAQGLGLHVGGSATGGQTQGPLGPVSPHNVPGGEGSSVGLRLGVGPLGVSWGRGGGVCTTVVPGGCLEEALRQNSVIPLPQPYTLLSPCSRDGWAQLAQGRRVQGPGRDGLAGFLLSEPDMSWSPSTVLGWGHVGPPPDFIISARMPGMQGALTSACACGPIPHLTSCLVSFRPKLWADFTPGA